MVICGNFNTIKAAPWANFLHQYLLKFQNFVMSKFQKKKRQFFIKDKSILF